VTVLAVMPRRSTSRRPLALLGVLLLVAGVVLAVVLLVLGPRYRDRQVDQLARGVVGCTTPLVFTETGTFYVFEEVAGPPDAGSDSCPATAQPGDFSVELRGGDGALELVDDRSVGYDSDAMIGTSIGRFEVAETGTYEMTVNGPDAQTLAAVGPDPDDVADSYRRWALIGGIAGVLIGLALVLVSGTGRTAASRAGAGSRSAADVSASPWAAPSADDRLS
jgi:hypothetical protein